VEWILENRRSRRRKAKGKSEANAGGTTVARLARITRLMALAMKFQGMVDRGEVPADLAGLGHVSRARITQLMNLLNLAPDIQEQI
jgi:hypothetical protein